MITLNFFISDSETEGSYDYDTALEKTGKIAACLPTNIVIRPYNYMSPVSSVFDTVVTVRIRLNNMFRVGTSILKY